MRQPSKRWSPTRLQSYGSATSARRRCGPGAPTRCARSWAGYRSSRVRTSAGAHDLSVNPSAAGGRDQRGRLRLHTVGHGLQVVDDARIGAEAEVEPSRERDDGDPERVALADL